MKTLFLTAVLALLLPLVPAVADDLAAPGFDARAYLDLDAELAASWLPGPTVATSQDFTPPCDRTLNPCEDACCDTMVACLNACGNAPRCRYDCTTQWNLCELTCHCGWC